MSLLLCKLNEYCYSVYTPINYGEKTIGVVCLVKKVVDPNKKQRINGHDGNTIFSYFSEGTNLLNENWMNRKFNTVVMNEMSSFKRWAISQYRNGTVEDQGLDSKDFAYCGGGFPVKLKNGEMVAVVLASNLPHEKDHKFIVEGLSEYLKVDGMPDITLGDN